MQFQNKNKIAYLASLTLLFSYAEMLLPRGIPFLRLGLGNIAVLLAFDLPLPSFFVLTVIKAAASSLMAGTLFSPFFLISLAQSVVSGFFMYALFYLNRLCKEKLVSVYGISVSGSAVSALIQIFLSSLYLGKGTASLLGVMLLFNLLSGLLTAFISTQVSLNQKVPVLKADSTLSERKKASDLRILITAIVILLCACGVFFIKSLYVLCAALVISFIFQRISGRKVKLLPHLGMWLFVLVSSVFVPEGRVLFKFSGFGITEGALLSGVEKALKLSTVSALSQCAANLRPSQKTLTGLSLCYYRRLLEHFSAAEGKLLFRLKSTLNAEEL